MNTQNAICYRMHTGDPPRSWSWMDGKPTDAVLKLAQTHGYPIEYGYPATQAACEWLCDENGTWDSLCGEAWQFTDGGPADNNYRFCHGCGKPVVAVDRQEATP